MKLITPSAVVEKLKLNASFARAALNMLAEEGKIKVVDQHHAQRIYTRATHA